MNEERCGNERITVLKKGLKPGFSKQVRLEPIIKSTEPIFHYLNICNKQKNEITFFFLLFYLTTKSKYKSIQQNHQFININKESQNPFILFVFFFNFSIKQKSLNNNGHKKLDFK